MASEMLIKAKKELYLTLLAVNPKELSDDDTDLMYKLSEDEDIQACLR